MGRPTLEELRQKVKLAKKVDGLYEALYAAWEAADEMADICVEDVDRSQFREWRDRRDKIGEGMLAVFGEAPDRPRTVLPNQTPRATPTSEVKDG